MRCPAPLGAGGSEHRAAQHPGDPGTGWSGNVGRPSPEPPARRGRSSPEAVPGPRPFPRKAPRGARPRPGAPRAPPGSEPLCRGWDADAALGWVPAALSLMRAPRCVWLLVPAPLPLPRTRPGTCRTEPRPSLPAGGIHGRGSGLRADPAVRRGMGILPSREKPLSAAPLAAVPAPSPLPTQAAPGGFQALALCDFPSGAGATAVLRMGEQLRVLSE